MTMYPPQLGKNGEFWSILFKFLFKPKEKNPKNPKTPSDKKFTIDFWDKIDPNVLFDVFTVVAQDNNAHLHIEDIKIDNNGKRLKIFVDVSGLSNQTNLEKDVLQKYETETQKREADDTINYIFIETLIQQNLPGSTNNHIDIKELLMSATFENNLSGVNIGTFANQVSDNAQQHASQHIYMPETKRNLSEAAAEIHELLKQLEQSNPMATELEQVTYINIATKPDIKERVIAALKEGGDVAIDEFVLDNKYIKVVKAVIKGWLESGNK